MNVPQPFVITVEELEGGIEKSRFGSTRTFRVPGANLRVAVLSSALGYGRGECRSCRNIQALTVELSLSGRARAAAKRER
jgi:hypothetical protein